MKQEERISVRYACFVLRYTALLILASAASATVAQAADSYEVRRGDTLFEIARKTLHEGVAPNQMLLGIYRANPHAFPGGNLDLLRPGQTLRIPDRQEVAAIDMKQAEAQGRTAAARRYWEGLARERRGDTEGALKAFLEAGEAGHGLAQRRLGQIYDSGNDAVERDYEVALKWFQRARAQGVPIPKPAVRAPSAR
ncbi:MAG: FimV N-terminal domain protein [Burkholderiales bacterium]|jgi:pilus assembly protein FimV|nr:FimV N-terminal domain protein [Burkholderiales bacterium]